MPGHGHYRSLLELVLDLAQIQYEMESRHRRGLSTEAMGQVERRLLTELHRRGLPIPPQAPR